METWKYIPDYESEYMVSDYGRIKRISTRSGLPHDRIRKLELNREGYEQIILCRDSKTKKFLVHRLVLMAFKGHSNLFANHLNGVKYDNRLSNLQYVTRQENEAHAVRLGLKSHGENHHCSKLTDKKVVTILTRANKGESNGNLAKEFGVSKTLIGRIVRRLQWKHINFTPVEYK